MARLQILELPEGAGDDRPPFVLVTDEVPTDEAGFDALRRDLGTHEDLVERIGSRAVLVFEDTIEIPGNDVPLDPDGHPLKFRIEPDFETFREQVQDEIRRAQAELRDAINRDAVTEPSNTARDADRLTRWRIALAEALGMDRLRDWDDIRNAATGLRKQRDEQADAIERVRRAPTKPELMNAQQENPTVWLHGYECGVLAARDALRPRNEPTIKPTDA